MPPLELGWKERGEGAHRRGTRGDEGGRRRRRGSARRRRRVQHRSGREQRVVEGRRERSNDRSTRGGRGGRPHNLKKERRRKAIRSGKEDRTAESKHLPWRTIKRRRLRSRMHVNAFKPPHTPPPRSTISHPATLRANRIPIISHTQMTDRYSTVKLILRRTSTTTPPKLLHPSSKTKHAITSQNNSTSNRNPNLSTEQPRRTPRAPNTQNSAAEIANRRTKTLNTSNTSTMPHRKNRATLNTKAVIDHHTISTPQITPNTSERRKQTLHQILTLSLSLPLARGDSQNRRVPREALTSNPRGN